MLTEEDKITIRELVIKQGFNIKDTAAGILIFDNKSSLFLDSWGVLEESFVLSLVKNKNTYRMELNDGTKQSLKLGLLYGN